MPTPKSIYVYPVSTISEAKIVLQPEFQPDLFDEQHLYVNLDSIRDQAYLSDLYFDLGYFRDTKNFEVSSDYIKIIFSGHRGSGKSAELHRIYNELNNPERYFTVFIDLEQEVEVGSFQYADFFSLLIHKLLESLKSAQIANGYLRLQQLAEQLLQDDGERTITNRRKSSTGLEGSMEGGFKLFGFGGKGSFKEVFSGENEISKTVRSKISRNTLGLINKLNVELIDVRMAIEEAGKGKDILFIIDGSEKIRHEVYQELFVQNGNILSEINVNMVAAVPIIAYFQIQKAPYKFTNRYVVPMIKLTGNDNARALMKAIISKRISVDVFLDEEALNKCVDFSGGCIRQLFHVVYESLKKSLGQKIEVRHVDAAVASMGRYLWEYLTEDHLKIIKDGNYRPADAVISELLYMLILLKYNGTIHVNPLLEVYPDFRQWMNN